MFRFLSAGAIASPKSLLADAIATALAAYLDVDPQLIQANLLTDTKISLHNIQIKPQRLFVAAACLVVTGSIDEIEFSWKWGGDAQTSSWVRETILTVRGCRIQIQPINNNNNTTTAAEAGASSERLAETAATPSSTPQGYWAQQVQQIVDHLTLNITDVEIAFHNATNSTTPLILALSSLQLISLGRGGEKDGLLQQRLSLERFQAHVIVDHDQQQHLPVIDGFGYIAHVQRVSGQRFSSLTEGLQITGQCLDPMVIHLQLPQLHALVPIFQAVLEPQQQRQDLAGSEPANSSNNNNNDPDPPVTRLDDESSSDPSAPPAPASPTCFDMPLPSLHILLPHNASIHMPNCRLQYRMDGSICQLTGFEGIHVNHRPCLELQPHSAWCLDGVKSQFTVGSAAALQVDSDNENWADALEQEMETTVAHIQLDEVEFQTLLRGLVELHETTRGIVDRGLELDPLPPSMDVVDGWSAVLQGTVTVLVQGCQGEVMEGSWKDMTVVLPSGSTSSLLQRLEMASVQFRSTTFGLSIDIPRLDLSSDKSEQLVAEPIEVTCASPTGMTDLQRFGHRFFDVGISSARSDTAMSLPLGISLTAIHMVIYEPKLCKITVQGVRLLKDLSLSCESAAIMEQEVAVGLEASLRGIQVKAVDGGADIIVKQIQSVRLPGIFHTLEPIENARIVWTFDSVKAALPSVYVALREMESMSSETSVSSMSGLMPKIVSLQIENLKVRAPPNRDDQSPELRVRPIDLSLKTLNSGKFVIESRSQFSAWVESGNCLLLESQLEGASFLLSPDFDMEGVKLSSLRIVQSSVEGMHIAIPTTTFDVKNSKLTCYGAVLVSLPSTKSFDQVSTLAKRLTTMVKSDRSNAADAVMSPIQASIPDIRVELQDGMLGLQISNTDVCGTELKCRHVEISAFGTMMGVSGLSLSIGEVFTLLMENLKVLAPPNRDDHGSELLVGPIDLSLKTLNSGKHAVESRSQFSARVESGSCLLLESQLEGASLLLSPDFDMEGVKLSSLRIVQSSVEGMHIAIPTSTFDVKNSKLTCFGAVLVSLPSTKSFDQVSTLAKRLTTMVKSDRSNAADAVMSPIQASIPDIRVELQDGMLGLQISNTDVCGTELKCRHVEISAFGTMMGVSGLSLSIGEVFTQVEVQRIDRCVSSLGFGLVKPIEGVNLNYADGELHVGLAAVELLRESSQEDGGPSATFAYSLSLPFSVALEVQQLILRNGSTSLQITPLIMTVYPHGAHAILLDMDGTTEVRLENQSRGFLDARVLGVSACLDDGFSLSVITCNGVHVGPSSFGYIDVEVPPLSMASSTGVITIDGSLVVSVDSVDSLQHIWSELVQGIGFVGESRTDDFRFSIMLPEIVINLSEMRAQGIASSLQANGNILTCQRMAFSVADGSGPAGLLAGIRAELKPSFGLSLECVETLVVPGVGALLKPAKDIRVSIVENVAKLQIPSLALKALAAAKSQGLGASSSLWLPVEVQIFLHSLEFVSGGSAGGTSFIRGLNVHLQPCGQDPLHVSGNGVVRFRVVSEEVYNSMLKVSSIQIAGVVNGANVDTVLDLSCEVGSTTVAAGFSSFDWTSIFTTQSEARQTPLNLPYCRLSPVTAHVGFTGNFVSTSTVLRIPEFVGRQDTTSSQVIQHFVESAFRRMPSFFSNAEVLGESISEMTAKGVGRSVLRSTVAGSVTGSVGGLIAVDSVKGAILSGKKGRGVDEADKYQFGDFTRGAIRGLRETARTGGEERRGTGDSYRFGDFTVGAVKSTSQYVGNNKSRLGGAGGSGVGMAIGTAVAGPLGFLAGSYIGSMAGSSAFSSQDKLEESVVSGGGDACEPPKHNDGDLLDMGPSISSRQFQSAAMSTGSVRPSELGTSGTAFGELDLLGGNQQSERFVISQSQSHDAAGPNRQFAESPWGPQPEYPLASFSSSQSPYASANHQSFQQTSGQHLAASMDRHRYQSDPFMFEASSSSGIVSLHSGQATGPKPATQAEQRQGYRFGDVTRSIVAEGKKKSGRSTDDGYKFGDFTRGLFGSGR